VQTSNRYGYEWSLSVYHTFEESYPRATETVNQMFDLSDSKIAFLLARGGKSWENYKKIVKTVDNWLRRPGVAEHLFGNPMSFYRTLGHWLQREVPQAFTWLLTHHREYALLYEHDSTGGTRGNEVTEGTHQLELGL